MQASMKRSEAVEQEVLFQWASYYPELRWMYAVPNGGSRNIAEARNLKRQGVKSGVSDIVLPLPRGKYHGAYIEMKVGRNKASDNQKDFLEFVNSQGYCGVVCYGFEEAKDFIVRYMKGENLDERRKWHVEDQKRRR